MKIKRELLLKALEEVYPGTSKKEDTDQSDCFGFKEGSVYVYNNGLSIRTNSGLSKDVIGAIKSKEFIDHIRRIKIEVIDVEDEGNLFLVKGRNERIKFIKEEKFKLPIGDVDISENWVKLSDNFIEGIKKVQDCAGTNEADFVTVCVHIHPDWVEAFDNFQMCRFDIKTNFKNSVIVRRDFIKHIIGYNVTEFSESDRWINFRNEGGLIVSCLKAVGQYPDITEFLKGEGCKWLPIIMPEGIGEKVEAASVSSANAEFNQVKIVLDGEKKEEGKIVEGKVTIYGLGATSEYKGWRSIDYKGSQISFMISPRLLSDIMGKHKACEITDGRLKVVGDNYIYCTCLSKVIEKDPDVKKTKKKKVVKGE